MILVLAMWERGDHRKQTGNLRDHGIGEKGIHEYIILWESTELQENTGLSTVFEKGMEAILFKL